MCTRPILQLEGITKIYREGNRDVVALRDITLTVWPGEWVAIVGPSGCGKSTLLHLIAGLDRPTSGRIIVEGMDLATLNEEELARWRRRRIGFVFQFFQLLPTLTAVENVQLPLLLAGQPRARARALELLEHVGLAHVAHRFPGELSGGEQQRVAIARALANEPRLLLADEPTGNLDSQSGAAVLALLEKTWQAGKTILLVTHDPQLIGRAQRCFQLRDGILVAERLLRC